MNKKSSIQLLVEEYERNLHSGRSFYMDAPALLDIVEYYTKIGKDYDAEFCLRTALRLHPTDEEVLLTQAFRLKDAGKKAEALQIVQSLSVQDSRNVLLFYAEESLGRGDAKQAEALLSSVVIEDTGERYDFYVEIAELFLDFGYVRRAANWLHKITDTSYIDYKHVCELRAECHYQVQEYTQAASALNEAIDLDPYDEVSWSQMAEIQYRSGSYREAIDSCDYALAIQPQSASALRIKIYALLGLDDIDAALDLYQTSAETLNEDYTIPMMLGEAMVYRREYDTALSFNRKALSNCPTGSADRMRIITDLSNTLIEMGRFDEAVETLMLACSEGQTVIEVYTRAAEACFRKGETLFAINYLRAAAEQEAFLPKNITPIIHLLHSNFCYAPAAKIWEKIIAFGSAHEAQNLPEVALACRMLHHAQYARMMEEAVRRNPSLTEMFFHHLYSGAVLADYPDLALREMESWTHV